MKLNNLLFVFLAATTTAATQPSSPSAASLGQVPTNVPIASRTWLMERSVSFDDMGTKVISFPIVPSSTWFPWGEIRAAVLAADEQGSIPVRLELKRHLIDSVELVQPVLHYSNRVWRGRKAPEKVSFRLLIEYTSRYDPNFPVTSSSVSFDGSESVGGMTGAWPLRNEAFVRSDWFAPLPDFLASWRYVPLTTRAVLGNPYAGGDCEDAALAAALFARKSGAAGWVFEVDSNPTQPKKIFHALSVIHAGGRAMILDPTAIGRVAHDTVPLGMLRSSESLDVLIPTHSGGDGNRRATQGLTGKWGPIAVGSAHPTTTRTRAIPGRLDDYLEGGVVWKSWDTPQPAPAPKPLPPPPPGSVAATTGNAGNPK